MYVGVVGAVQSRRRLLAAGAEDPCNLRAGGGPDTSGQCVVRRECRERLPVKVTYWRVVLLIEGCTWSPPSELEYSSDEHFSEWSDDNHGSTSDAGSEPDLGDDDSDRDDMCLSHPDAVTPAPEPPAAKTHAEARPT